MAIQLEGTGSSAAYLRRSTQIVDHNAAYSIGFWFCIFNDKNDYGHLWAANADSVTDVSGDYVNADYLGTAADGTTLSLSCYVASAGTTEAGPACTVGTWYHAFIVRNSPTDLRLYINNVQQGATITRDVSARAATVAEFIGKLHLDYGQDMRVVGLKRWTAALDSTERAAEAVRLDPARTANLIGWSPMNDSVKAQALRDITAGVSWTEAGTVTSVDGPSDDWNAPVPVVSNKLQIDGVPTSTTFNAAAIGFTIAAGEDYIFKVTHYVSGAGNNISGVTIGGTAATLVGRVEQGESAAEIWIARNVAASNTDVVVAYSAGVDNYITGVLLKYPTGTFASNTANASGTTTATAVTSLTVNTSGDTTVKECLTFAVIGSNTGTSNAAFVTTAAEFATSVTENNASAHQAIRASYKQEITLGTKTCAWTTTPSLDLHAVIVSLEYNTPDITIALTGVGATGAVGVVTVYAPPSTAPIGTFDRNAVAQGWYDDDIGAGGVFDPDLLAASGSSPDITLALTGVSSTVSPGTLAASFSKDLATLLATGSVGTLAAAVSKALTGISGTHSPGSLVPSSVVGLLGVVGTGAVGTPSAGGDVTLSVTGVQSTLSVGSVSPAAAKALTGSAATTSVGSLSVSASVAVTGVVGTYSPGAVVPSFNVPLLGVAGAGGVGTPSAGSDVVLAITGVQTLSALGSIVPTLSVAVSGQSATGLRGNVAPVFSLPLTGTFGTGAAGSIAGVASTVPLIGQGGTWSVGTIGVAADTSITRPLTGVTVTGEVGSLGVAVAVTPSGTQSVAAVGAPSPQISVAATGVQSTGQVGSTQSAFAKALTAVASAAGAVGDLLVSVLVELAGVIAVPDAGYVVAVGGISDYQPDPDRLVRIKAESRVRVIGAESRHRRISAEARYREVHGETRHRSITREIRIRRVDHDR